MIIHILFFFFQWGVCGSVNIIQLERLVSTNYWNIINHITIMEEANIIYVYI